MQQNEYLLTFGACRYTEDGVMVRPFFIDKKLVYEMDIGAAMSEDQAEIKKFCRAIINHTGIEITVDELPEIMRSKKIIRKI